jgi:hypothetical protein
MIAAVTRAASTAAALAVLLLPAAAQAGIRGGPHEVRVGETRTIDIDFTNEVNERVATVQARVPAHAVLITASASDPAWIATRRGRDLEWHGGQLLQGAHLHVRLLLRFPQAGDASPFARLTYVGGASEETPILVDVRGTASRNDVLVVLAAGAAIFLGAVAIFVIGRRAARE